MKLSNQRSDPDLQRQVTTLAAVLGSIAINTLSNIFPLNGVSVGDFGTADSDVSTPEDRSGARFAAITLVHSPADFNLSRLD
jgi:hypothetical protein